MKRQLHTPEGVRDIWGKECEKKHWVDRRIKDTILSFGYEQIETPAFEFFDVFSRDIGTTPSKDLYKFFDREGNTLALRPDVTPSVARAYASYLEDSTPVRLFYSGNIYINHSSLMGRLKETTQIGAEYIGEPSIEADAELVSLAVEALKSTGLDKFTISIGHVDFLRGLIEAYDFSEEEEEEIYDRVINKNLFGLQEILSSHKVSEELKELYFGIGQLYEEPEGFNHLKPFALGHPLIEKAFSYLERLYELLKHYGTQSHVSFDLGLVSQYRYYTGILFSGYTYGSGEAILKGGRYDSLLSHFGCDKAAIGFAIHSDSLAIALERQGVSIPLFTNRRAYLYTEDTYTDMLHKASKDRRDGKWAAALYRLPSDKDERERLIQKLREQGQEIFGV